MIRQGRRVALWSTTLILLVVIGWLAIQWPHHSLWYDETLTTWVASGPIDRLFHWCTQVDIQVPFHYLVLRGWMALVGNSELTLHLLSAIFGLLSVAGLMALVRRLAGVLPGVVVGLLMGFSPGFLWIAYEVRSYSLALALAVWATVFLQRLLRSGPVPRRIILAYWLLMVAMLYTHYTGIAVVASHALIILGLALSRRDWHFVRRMVIVGTLIALSFAPWLPVLLSRGSGDQSYYTGSILPDQTLGVILSFKWLARDDFRWVTPDNTLTPQAPLVFGGLLLLIAWMVLWRLVRRSWRAILYGLALAIPPIVMVAVIVYFRPKLAGRYAWPAWIGLDLLLACGLVALSDLARRYRAGVALVVAGLFVAIPWLSGQTGHPPNSDFRGVFAYIREHWQDGDQVLLRDGTLFPAAEYYHSPPYIRLPQHEELTNTAHVVHMDEAVATLQDQPASHGIWIVSWQGDVMDPENVSTGVLETIGTAQQVPHSWGDVGLQYFVLKQPLSTLQAPERASTPLAVMSDGLTLESASIVTSGPLAPGEPVIVHSWWSRHDPVSSTARVSIRLTGSDGTTYAQIDQPPSGWFYFPDHWPADTLILGRYEIPIPTTIKPTVATVSLVLYSASGGVPPITVTAGIVKIGATSPN